MSGKNALKLTPYTVHQIRAFKAAGFSDTTIARVINVCPRTVRDVVKGRSWAHLPVEPTRLPYLTFGVASLLRFRGASILTDEQRKTVEQYAARLVETANSEARSALASTLIRTWSPSSAKRRQRKRLVRNATTTAVTAAASSTRRDPSPTQAALVRG